MQHRGLGRQDSLNAAGNRGSYRCLERLCCGVTFACCRNSVQRAAGGGRREEQQCTGGGRDEERIRAELAHAAQTAARSADQRRRRTVSVQPEHPQAHASPIERAKRRLRYGASLLGAWRSMGWKEQGRGSRGLKRARCRRRARMRAGGRRAEGRTRWRQQREKMPPVTYTIKNRFGDAGQQEPRLATI